MAVEIVVAGRYGQGSIIRKRTPGRLVEELDGWWRRRFPDALIERDDTAEAPALAVHLHPAAEPAVFEIPEPGTLVVTARTSSAGPGYHRALVDGLHALGRDLDVRWADGQAAEGMGDETGYFETGERAMVDEVMLDWAQGLARAVLENDEDGSGGFELGLGMAWTFTTPAFARTQLGPRDRAAFEAIAADAAAGRILFPWWDDRPTPEFYRDRALVRMWTDVRWREPWSDDERDVLEAVDADLGRASGAADVPWHAWNEIRGFLGRAPVTVPPGVAPERPIGYRREGTARARLGAWTVEVPAAFAETSTDEGTLVLFGDEGNVRLSVYEARPDAPDVGDALAGLRSFGLTPGVTAILVDEDGRLGWASEREVDEDGDRFQALQGTQAVAGSLAFTTITHEAATREWALSTFRSIRHDPVEPASSGVDEPDASAGPRLDGAAWDHELARAAVDGVVRRADDELFAILDDGASAGYVQLTLVDGRIHAEAAGARYDPRIAEPGRQAALSALGWSGAQDAFAGNHVREWAADADPDEVATVLLDTLRRVYDLPGEARVRVTLEATDRPDRT